ncbi:MAG: methyltransferase domain-containing protein [Clostridia bacterium]|nr:methyltransferase domain-containing protein [Clostridia bacterium]
MNRRIDERILDSLSCPCCSEQMRLSEDERSLVCRAPRRHCFDFASAGYVNLALTHSGGGDSKDAVRSRTEFLESGAYERVSDAVNSVLSDYISEGGLVIDAGCGEGYYSCRAARAGFRVAGFDLSKDAVAQAAKRAKREGLANAFFGVGSVFSLPVADSSSDAVVNIFAPCAEAEYCRVLKNGGILAVAYAGREHLMGLKRKIYDSVYTNESRSDMPEGMELLDERRVLYDIELSSEAQIKNLFAMTPYYWRTSAEDKNKLEGLNSLRTEVDIIIAVYRKNG